MSEYQYINRFLKPRSQELVIIVGLPFETVCIKMEMSLAQAHRPALGKRQAGGCSNAKLGVPAF